MSDEQTNNDNPENENETGEKGQEPTYPGKLSEYHRLRELRESLPVNDPNTIGLQVAEQLAGLAYILDGIRYAARNS